MAESLVLILSLECAALLLWGLLRPGRIYEFPFLAGAVFTGFVLPQFIGLLNSKSLPPGGLEKTIVMTILCAGTCYLGYAWNLRPMRMLDWQFDEKRLLWFSAVLTMVGVAFHVATSRLPAELIRQAQWTGLPVFYRFFSELLTYGFAISLLLLAKKRSKHALLIALLGSLFYLDRILIMGRRGVTIEFILMILLAFWFQRRRSVPRAAMLIAILAGALVVNAMGKYREITMNEETPYNVGTVTRVASVDYVGNVEGILSEGGVEITNAVYEIEAVDRRRSFDFGLFHWNTLMFNYVPAQLFGKEFKQSVMIDLEDSAYEEFRYRPTIGSTQTGMADAFGSFWYFGCLKFFLISALLFKLYGAATHGHFNAQLCYMLILVSALHSITHHTQWFFSPWVHMGIFLIPGLFLAKRQDRPRAYRKYALPSNS